MTHRVWFAIGAFCIAAVAVVAFIAYGGIGAGGTPRQQLRTWVTDSGLGQSIGTLHDDGAHVSEVLDRHRGTPALHTICGVLTTDAEAANSHLPSPDTQVTQILAKAYGLEYDAGTNCYAAGVGGTKLLAKSAAERAEAQRLFSEALARIRAVTAQSVATTTTTVPTTTTGFL
ncbi:MAG: hypothetical protein ACYDHU_04825 [Acidimicrobiales bacterium]